MYPLFQTYLDFTSFKNHHYLFCFPLYLPPFPLLPFLPSSHFHHFLSVPHLNWRIFDFPDSSDSTEPPRLFSLGHFDQLKADVGPVHFSYELRVCSSQESSFCQSYFAISLLCFILYYLNLGRVTPYGWTCIFFLNLYSCLLQGNFFHEFIYLSHFNEWGQK